MANFKTGDKITLRFGEIAVLAEVVMASSNGVSLFVNWEEPIPYRCYGPPGTFAVCFGGLPILRGADGVYRCLLDEQVVTLEPVQ